MFNIKISLAIRKLLERVRRHCGSVHQKQREKEEKKRDENRDFFVFELILQPVHDIPNIWLIDVLGSIN